ncbi:MAG: nucleotidyltransferase substrate binding protein [Treponema sp.]|jgi:nucleotidyltransferase substrate binding protein (TIGR01987 family)|nr:nucleotidyltransferase substrate binding protein [Treponema sp.]
MSANGMNNNEQDITGLKNAVASLERALNIVLKKERDKTTEPAEIELLHAGLIQNFEFAYEIGWKQMKKWLEFNIGRNSVAGITRNELFRLAAENLLIADVEKWMDFHKARNSTAHEYSGMIAENVYEKAKEFLPHVKDLLTRLEART